MRERDHRLQEKKVTRAEKWIYRKRNKQRYKQD